jgi:NlpC/P60 family putative phage cell wall peptidase
METKESPPPCGETEARSDPGGGRTSQIVSFARSWIGTPYVHQASVKGVGCDCLGLLRGVWRELRGGEPESPPPYSADWAEARGEESLRDGLARHLTAIDIKDIAPGDVALFRMVARGPAKHCAIVGNGTLIHARQNKRVSEEVFTSAWRRKLAYAFRL